MAARRVLAFGIIALAATVARSEDAVPLPPIQIDAGEAGEPEDANAIPPDDGEGTDTDDIALPTARPDIFEGEPEDADIEDIVSADPPGDEAPTCRGRLKALGVAFEALDPIVGKGECGLKAPLKVTAIGDIALQGSATLNCQTAEALAAFLLDAAVPAAEEHLEATPNAVAIGSSYVCRTRNSRAGAKLSEHAIGNGVDIMSFGFPERDSVAVAAFDADLPEFRFLANIRVRACDLFTTVLGPGSDDAHANHFHLDLRQRKNDYRLCQ